MPTNHAFLSASASHRWLACPPSAKACEGLPDEPSEFALQGTDCHELCAYKVEHALGRDVKNPTENLTYYDGEMENCAEEYCSFVLEQIEEAKTHCSDPLVMVEQSLDFSKWVPDGFGTGDCVIVADDEIHIIDYKHGMGVLVDAKGNSQMRCYALGALNLYDGIYDINKIVMTIFQPRKANVSTDIISKEELLKWAKEVLKPTAELAMKGEGEFKAGEHCQFCKIKHTCRKRAEYNLEMAKYDFKMPDTLSNDEISIILEKAESLSNWVNDVKDYALSKALDGIHFDGWKVVEGRSIRKFKDEYEVADIVTKAGFDPYEKKLMGITAMTSLLGKKKFNSLLGEMVYKPKGKPTLVKESDAREEYTSAEDDFKDEEE